MARRSHPLAGLLVAGVLAALVTALGLSFLLEDDEPRPDPISLDDDAPPPEVALDGQAAPDFTYERLDDQREVTFADRRDGRPAVVNFFAAWCPPCIAEMPGFELVHRDLGDRVLFLGLSERETIEEARDLVERTGVTYEIGRDPAGEILTGFSGVGMPTTVLVDADGTVTSTHTGELRPDELEARIRDELL